jgi:hypothetical protein
MYYKESINFIFDLQNLCVGYHQINKIFRFNQIQSLNVYFKIWSSL